MKIKVVLPEQGVDYPEHTFEVEICDDGTIEIYNLIKCQVDALTPTDLRAIADALEAASD